MLSDTNTQSNIQVSVYPCFIVVYENEYGHCRYQYEQLGSCGFMDSMFQATVYDMNQYYRWSNIINNWNKNREYGKYYLLKINKTVMIELVD